MSEEADSILNNRSGSALVVGLIMIIVMTLIALAASYSSIFEIQISGNKRGSTDAFYSADAGFNTIGSYVQNFDLGKYDPVLHTYNPFNDPTIPNPTNAVATITYVPTQSGPPRGTGFSAVNLGYAYYQILSTGNDQATVSSPSTAQVQGEVVRLLPIQ